MPLVEATWKRSGTLDEPASVSGGGTYAFVHSGAAPRLVYVGTAIDFEARWRQHRELFLKGGRTVWRPGPGEDAYTLMTYPPGTYERLAKECKVWIPGNTKQNAYFEPLYAENGDYTGKGGREKGWEQWVESTYLPSLAIWRCELADPANAVVLESQVQAAFASEYSIKFYRRFGSQTWLGKREVVDSGRVGSVAFRFESVPDLGPAARALFADLHKSVR